MGRCAPAIIYFILCSGFFMALKLGVIFWTLHLCSHCFRLFWMMLWRTQLGSGKVRSRTRRTSSSSGSSSSSSDKTRQGKTTHVFPAILWRYPGDTRKWKKGTPRHQSIPLIILTQPHLQVSKGENPTQSNSQGNWHIREIPSIQERR